ncbi:MAG: bifunctional diguanylate cyclase/phosphodiesterase, partial [Gammaproteobacteria bacterium]|nr:bifunctional diguanylate cyclase/phosphodiesterase [Gammaproteobacteria bacterium]
MNDKAFYSFLNKQILVLIVLSLFPGLGYILLGWLHDLQTPALIWYALNAVVSIWGYRLYRQFRSEEMGERRLQQWYRQLSLFYYIMFGLWVLIFLIYVKHDQYNLHYIAVFTELGASVVASTLLTSDRRLFTPIIYVLMLPLVVYFLTIGEWYGYVLTVFASVFTWLLLYAANSSYKLLMKTRYQATHDVLTGLNNRYFFINYLQQMMNTLKESGYYCYLLLIDLDHFKTINDSLGHDVGDQLLKEVADRLRMNKDSQGMVARLGGDEFIVTGVEIKSEKECKIQAMVLANELIEVLKKIYIIDRHHLYISSSVGVSIVSSLSSNANSFIKEADIAMYEVKARGRDGVFMFDKEMSERVEGHLEIERLLHFALLKNEIRLNYQPQIDKDNKVIGAECLVRWNNEKLGNVPPNDFIPIAEQTGLIVELGNYIIESAFRTFHDWCEKGIILERFSINVSMRQFFHYSFVDEVERLSHDLLSEAERSKVIFELTETIVAEDVYKVIEIINQLKMKGFQFSMDDFGTGYSSLSYLKQLPINEIKIDRAFVNALTHSEGDQAMIETILNMANIFKLLVVA